MTEDNKRLNEQLKAYIIENHKQKSQINDYMIQVEYLQYLESDLKKYQNLMLQKQKECDELRQKVTENEIHSSLHTQSNQQTLFIANNGLLGAAHFY